MKVGDTFPVTIAGQTVAQARVREVAEGQVVLVVPGTVVVMATRTQIDVPETQQDTTGTETVITDVERSSSAPVAETPESTNSTTSTTEPVAGGDNAQQQTTPTSEGNSEGTEEVAGPSVQDNTSVSEATPTVDQGGTE